MGKSSGRAPTAGADGFFWRCWNLPLREVDLKGLRKSLINHKANEFTGVQIKTNREYHLPINEVMWELIRTAPGDHILDFAGWDHAVGSGFSAGAGMRKDLQKRDLRREAARYRVTGRWV